MTEISQSSSLAELERRWSEEPSPPLALHLAEEHRRLGNLERAIEVTRTGLTHHPGHLAARVALGRYLLDDGQAAEAVETLQSVVGDDPAHLVANKLLVTGCLATGDIDGARERLMVYKTLSPADPDVEDLESSLADAETDAGTRAETNFEEVDPVPPVPGEDSPEEPSAVSREEPFAGIWGAPDRSAYASALAGEGIFQLPDDGSAPVKRQSTAETPPEAVREDLPEATVTLGRLYLEQGHLDEAKRIFNEVLAREPGSSEALEGLRQVKGGGRALTATDLVDEALLGSSDTLHKKRLVLESYRSRLRAGSTGGS